MDEITVKKVDLLKKLKENRTSHRADFELALEGWYQTGLKELERLVKEAKANKQVNFFLSLPRPEDHTTDYDRAIEMLEMDIDTEVILDEHEFRTFVQDDWGWKKAWNTSNFGYVAAASS